MIVLDASVMVKCYLDEPGSASALATLAKPEVFMAPELMRIEVASAICKHARQAIITPHAAESRCVRWFAHLDEGIIRLLPHATFATAAMQLALRLGHPLPDCFYLAIAMHYDIPLLTADRVLVERAKAHYANTTLFE